MVWGPEQWFRLPLKALKGDSYTIIFNSLRPFGSGLAVPDTTGFSFTPFKFKYQVRFPHVNAYLDVVWGPEQWFILPLKALKGDSSTIYFNLLRPNDSGLAVPDTTGLSYTSFKLSVRFGSPMLIP